MGKLNALLEFLKACLITGSESNPQYHTHKKSLKAKIVDV
jgi:hypothetical protein